MKKRHALAAALVFLASTISAGARAQSYPDHPITLVVPYAAGGGNDVLARLVAERMSKSLGQQIVIENRGGAGGTIATRQVAKSAPDGYTLLIATSSLAINPSLYPNIGYDPRKDFAPVGLIASSSNVVLLHPSVPASSIAELIALAKASPGKLNFASTGSGSSVHLAAELFASMAGIKLTHVPYRGSAPALTDLLGGHVDIMFGTLPPSVGLVRQGKLRALAVTGPQRSSALPELPTVAEAGLPGYEAVLHYGLVAAAGTPRPLIDKLNTALRAALAEEALQQRLAVEGAEPLPSTPEEYAADIDREEIKWSRIVRESGAKGE
ncbi:MAG: hypothetical protein QOJ96_3420 [Alphaproteobacteria bacterium]|jgi:tripartite-type tricarboxylate transporter receptor subunit TctC|nr:hypothetical protein [Alphaproteobacteria bacterium]